MEDGSVQRFWGEREGVPLEANCINAKRLIGVAEFAEHYGRGDLGPKPEIELLQMEAPGFSSGVSRYAFPPHLFCLCLPDFSRWAAKLSPPKISVSIPTFI